MCLDHDVITIMSIIKTINRITGEERTTVRGSYDFDEREWKRAVATAMRKIPVAMHGLVADEKLKKRVIEIWKKIGWKYGGVDK